MSLPSRPLEGCTVNLSISQSDNGEERGFPSWQVNRITLQLVAALFGQGASVVFGHDWREDGVMEAVYGFARQVQAPVPLSSEQSATERQPLLLNLLPWPEKPYLPEQDLELLSSTLQVERVGLPNELEPLGEEASHLDPSQGVYRYMRARGLTFLRRQLNNAAHARTCLGGSRSDYEGRYPGIVEEALVAVTTMKPLYIAGFLGGAAEQVIDAIEGKQMTEEFCPATPVQGLYETPPVPERDQSTQDDRTIDRAAVWNSFARTGREQLAAANRLTPEENDELHRTPVIDRAIELILIGLSRLQQPTPQNALT
jgi:hypothetical protein